MSQQTNRPAEQSVPDDDVIDLHRVFQKLFQQKFLILCGALFGMALAYLYHIASAAF